MKPTKPMMIEQPYRHGGGGQQQRCPCVPPWLQKFRDNLCVHKCVFQSQDSVELLKTLIQPSKDAKASAAAATETSSTTTTNGAETGGEDATAAETTAPATPEQKVDASSDGADEEAMKAKKKNKSKSQRKKEARQRSKATECAEKEQDAKKVAEEIKQITMEQLWLVWRCHCQERILHRFMKPCCTRTCMEGHMDYLEKERSNEPIWMGDHLPEPSEMTDYLACVPLGPTICCAPDCGKREVLGCAPFVVCGRCRRMCYCSAECQRHHYREAHKYVCNELIVRDVPLPIVAGIQRSTMDLNREILAMQRKTQAASPVLGVVVPQKPTDAVPATVVTASAATTTETKSVSSLTSGPDKTTHYKVSPLEQEPRMRIDTRLETLDGTGAAACSCLKEEDRAVLQKCVTKKCANPKCSKDAVVKMDKKTNQPIPGHVWQVTCNKAAGTDSAKLVSLVHTIPMYFCGQECQMQAMVDSIARSQQQLGDTVPAASTTAAAGATSSSDESEPPADWKKQELEDGTVQHSHLVLTDEGRRVIVSKRKRTKTANV